MRIVDIRERAVPISRFADSSLPSGGLTTSIVALVTDVVRDGRRVVGYGFSSVGRYAQSGLIAERFGPRVLAASDDEIASDDGTTIDPFRAWNVMMRGEKPGGHGERCVAVGTLDMAIWDAAAKIAGLPLYRFIARWLGREDCIRREVDVYGGGGYYYPTGDIAQLEDEMRRMLDLGYTHAKIKIGSAPLERDLERIEAAAAVLGGADRLAVDAMNSYDSRTGLEAAAAFEPIGLWWFEDICDPLDFATYAEVAKQYSGRIVTGEALFSAAEAKLMAAHAGLRPRHDILLFDPVHTYGLPGFLAILAELESCGWARTDLRPHGGHLFALHVISALGLGGAEGSPFAFAPFGGYTDNAQIRSGRIAPPGEVGIGFEHRADLWKLFRTLS